MCVRNELCDFSIILYVFNIKSLQMVGVLALTDVNSLTHYSELLCALLSLRSYILYFLYSHEILHVKKIFSLSKLQILLVFLYVISHYRVKVQVLNF
jgi:hypothetical protein